MNLQLFCICGAAWWIVGEGERALGLVAAWERRHGAVAGLGHAPCSSVEAWRARLRLPVAMADGGRVTGTERES